MSIEFVRKALDRSFVMGQNYWADADSESRSANRRSEVTRQNFNTMRDAICEATATMLTEKDALLQDALRSLEFYRCRCDALQQAQSKMRDPERTVVCDILANGMLLDPPGDRYKLPDPNTPLT